MATQQGFFHRLYKTLFGSDAYEAYTAVYTWLSNQAAHAGFGFAVTGLPLALWPQETWVPWVVVLVPLGKEVIDYLIGASPANRWFATDRRELATDGITDIGFWWLGIWLALAGIGGIGWGWWVVVADAGLLVLAFRHFIAEKGRFDRSGLPFFRRLVRYEGAIRPAPDIVRDFVLGLRRGGPTRHIAVCGGRGTGKTPLGVSIGCELSVAGRNVRYATAFELAELLQLVPTRLVREESLPGTPVNPLAGVELLVIDNINLDRNAPVAASQIAARLPQVTSTLWLFSSAKDEVAAEHDVRQQLATTGFVYLPAEEAPPKTEGIVPRMVRAAGG